MQTHVPDHLHRIVMTQLTIKNTVHHFAGSANLFQQPLDVRLDETKRRTDLHLATVAILAPFGPSPLPTALRLWWGLHRCFRGLYHLFDQHRVRRAAFDTEQGYTQKTQARYRLPIERRKKPIEALG